MSKGVEGTVETEQDGEAAASQGDTSQDDARSVSSHTPITRRKPLMQEMIGVYAFSPVG